MFFLASLCESESNIFNLIGIAQAKVGLLESVYVHAYPDLFTAAERSGD